MEDVVMRNYDFSPLWRSSVGFDRLFDLINNARQVETQDNFPPYDIVRTGEDTYRISLAVAGFAPDDIAVTAQQNMLTVTGRKSDGGELDYLYQGIAARPFERQFSLADYVEVERAWSDNGLLQIDLVRRVPEAMKVRRIEINAGHSGNKADKKSASHVKAV
jgi:molecular chaperone IbpA